MVARSKKYQELIYLQMYKPLPDEPELKKFKRKHNLPVLNSYKGPADENYWKVWPQLCWKKGKEMKSPINPEVLLKLGKQTNYPFPCLLKEIYRDIKHGASLGVSKDCQVTSTATNAPSAFEDGEKVSDELASWISKGFVIGPMEKKDIPFKQVKISGLMTKTKPNGSVRPILNFSRGDPKSLNEGIDTKDFPTVMSSTEEWVRILLRCGIRAKFCKNDWASAYKHIRVKNEEVWMQGFKWLDRYFFELCLVFGGGSSAGLYDRLAKLVLWIALEHSKFPHHLCIQHLDDVCAASSRHSDSVDNFHATYVKVCDKIGVELADPTDPDKAFPPTTNGIVLGICYDTEEGINGTWYLREDKMANIILMLEKAIEGEESSQRFVKSLCGKLIHLRCLVDGSKFKMGQIILAANQTEVMTARVSVTDWCRSDLFWWKQALPVHSYRSPLVDPDRRPGPAAIISHTDAAGGSLRSFGKGVGMTIFPDIWTFVMWGKKINCGEITSDGKSLDSLMSAWELLGPLLTLCTAPDRVRNKQVVVMVDNEGSVQMFAKGWTTKCQICNSILVAIHEIAMALNVDLFVDKIRRCSTDQARAADALSKADFCSFRQLMPEATPGPKMVPVALSKWIQHPGPDRFLGLNILAEMSKKTFVLGFNV